MALNSYENRVYQIGLEQEADSPAFLIAKFYRPERWTNQQIQEEHDFAHELQANEIPVVAPLGNAHGDTLFQFNDFRFALFPREGGYAPEPGNFEQLERLGTFLGRIHSFGQEKLFHSRETFSLETRLFQPKQFLIDNHFIPDDLLENYQSIYTELEQRIIEQCDGFKQSHFIKCHGDWHLGNILWREDSGGHIVDLDDCMNAPAVQDIWMMLSGESQDQALQLQAILKGYETFCFFDRSELKLIESLRSIRIVFYAAWLAKRWHDPAFPMSFPWFNTRAYWQQHIRELQDQIELIDSNLALLF